jgi:hypothetical protein
MMEPPDSEQAMLRELLDAEKACPDPPVEASARVFARLSHSLGLPPSLGDGPPTAPGPTVDGGPLHVGLLRRTLAGLSRRGLATFVLGAAVGATTYGTVQHLRGKTAAPASALVPAPLPAAEPPSPLPPAVVEPAETTSTAEPSRLVAEASRERGTTPGLRNARDLRLGAERKLIEMARSALARGHTERALAALRSHARSYPRGQLAEERESLMVQALVAWGEPGRARERAARFHRRYPHSLFGPVVDEALRSIP